MEFDNSMVHSLSFLYFQQVAMKLNNNAIIALLLLTNSNEAIISAIYIDVCHRSRYS